MQIEIIGARCVTCTKYTQYYAPQVGTGEMQPINHGYCGQSQCITRSGGRCKYYHERGSIEAVCRPRPEEHPVCR